MIKISIIIKQSTKNLFRFTVDEQSRFIMTETNGNECVICENSSHEFDGVCDEDGRMHFLIQTNDGSLIYIKYDSEEWKKYVIFKSKSKSAKISNICLTWERGILCGFYAMEHKGKNMLIKHIFSSSNLYATPEVIDTLDSRKSYCPGINSQNKMMLFYRNENGEFIEKTFEKFISNSSDRILNNDKEMYDFACVCNGERTFSVYVAMRKGYTALIFSDLNGTEKIITFAVEKKCMPSVFAMGDYVVVQWSENGAVMEVVSHDAGKTFSKPKINTKYKSRSTYREKGIRPGLYFSGPTVQDKIDINYFDNIISDNFESVKRKERTNNMNVKFSKPNDNKIFADINPSVFENKLSSIEKEVEKIGNDISKICIFLDELVKFKKDASKINEPNTHLEENTCETNNEKINYDSNIGEENTENIKLFESLDFDDLDLTKSQKDNTIFEQGRE